MTYFQKNIKYAKINKNKLFESNEIKTKQNKAEKKEQK